MTESAGENEPHVPDGCSSRTPSRLLVAWVLLFVAPVISAEPPTTPAAAQERMAEWTIESSKSYQDPFNDVDIDVIFEAGGRTWRVPTYWSGGNRWTVRFAPPEPGLYTFHLESTDKANPDLNGHGGKLTITPYRGNNPLLKGGMIQVSSNKRYFVHFDGSPFLWLGDTWWSGLSGRLSWSGFQQLTRDRREKGFTVVQICAGLIPSNEELAPRDPGFCNEGGCVWESGFTRINPTYFDFADRRIQYLIDQGIAPAIFGGWRQVLAQMGLEKMKKHWRYIIARYGAYPVLWVAGGEIYDPPVPHWHSKQEARLLDSRGWTEVVRYIRASDPYQHPLSVHEIDPPFDTALKDPTLTDFDLFQAGHRGWPSIATAIALLNKHYARTKIIKPLVVGEIGYERLAGENHEDYQRAAFWLSMLNGAAGFTYGNISTAEAYSVDKPFLRVMQSPYTWEEGMHFPGGAQIAMGAALLRNFAWWKMTPHPEWVTPRGTTLLEPNTLIEGFRIDLIEALQHNPPPADRDLPLGEWAERKGNWRLPYVAGVPGEFRLIYLPYSRFSGPNPRPTILGLEPHIRYHSYYWEPTLGVRYDLGLIEANDKGQGSVNTQRLERRLTDAKGNFRGELRGGVWDDFGKHQKVLGTEYTPEPPPAFGDWLLVLEAEKGTAASTIERSLQ